MYIAAYYIRPYQLWQELWYGYVCCDRVSELPPDGTAQQITKRAVCEMVVHNAKIANVDYTLHFPDGKRVITLLEKTDVPFTLCGYQKELLKDYSKIALFLKAVEAEFGLYFIAELHIVS